jgi:hypothetical protein
VHTDVEAGPSTGAPSSSQERTDVRTSHLKDCGDDHDYGFKRNDGGIANSNRGSKDPNESKSADTRSHSTDMMTGPNPYISPSTVYMCVYISVYIY